MLLVKNLYTQLKDRLFELVPEIELIMLYNNQFTGQNEGRDDNAIPLPAVFISIPNVQYEQKGELTATTRNVDMSIYIATQSLDPDNEDLYMFELCQKIHEAIHGFEPVGYANIIIQSFEKDENHSNLYINKLNYVTSHFEDSTLRNKENVPVVAQPFVIPDFVSQIP